MYTPHDLMTPREVASRVRVSLRTFWHMVARRELPRVKVSQRSTRVPRAAVEEYLRRRTVPARAAVP